MPIKSIISFYLTYHVKYEFICVRSSSVMVTIKKLFPGVLISSCVAFIAFVIQQSALFTKLIPVSPLILAIIFGFVLNNTIRLPSGLRHGIKFSAKRILRLAIVFLGFKLSLAEIVHVGAGALVTISVSSGITLLFTIWLGRKMGIPLKRSILLASGVSICGASAVAAVDGVIQSKEEDAAYAIGAITLFGTIFMLIYPVIYSVAGLPDAGYALWAGSSIHEVAQVSAAGSVMNNAVSEALASSVKMIRVLFIMPLTLVLLLFPWQEKKDTVVLNQAEKKGKVSIPWFAVLFFVAVIVNSIHVVPSAVTRYIVVSDNFLMTVAMAGLGLDISMRSMLRIGKNAFLLGVVSSLMLSALSGGIIYIMYTR